jgi:type I restriction enzyme R subunit
LLESLAEKGFGLEQLSEISRMINAEKSDVFDVRADSDHPLGAGRDAQS